MKSLVFPRHINYERHIALSTGWSKWITPRKSGYKLACCDCALTHIYQYRIRGKDVEFRVRLDKRATAGQRRGRETRERIAGLQ